MVMKLRPMIIKRGKIETQGKKGLFLSDGSTGYNWGKRRRHESGHMWHVSRMEANKQIN